MGCYATMRDKEILSNTMYCLDLFCVKFEFQVSNVVCKKRVQHSLSQ